MTILYFWFFYIIIGATLLIGKAIACRIMNMHHSHYQIGYSPSLISLKIWGVRFSMGIIIPIPWLFKIYEIHDNEKRKATPIWIRRKHSFFKRFIGVISGVALLYVITNILSIINYYSTEQTYLSVDSVNKNGIYVEPIGEKIGFKTGDKIIKIEGKSYERYDDIKKAIILDKARQFTIIRGDSVQELTIYNEDAIHKLLNYHNKTFYPISSGFPLTIDSIIEGGSAELVGLQKGDELITINEDTILYQRDLSKLTSQNKNTFVSLGFNRDNSKTLIKIDITPDSYGKLGVFLRQDLEYSVEDKSFVKALNSGNRIIQAYLNQFKLNITQPSDKHIGGFNSIGYLFAKPFPNLAIICYVLLSFIGLTLIPTPFTDSRFLIALCLDQIIKLPKSMTAWIGWVPFIVFIVYANIKDLIKVFFM